MSYMFDSPPNPFFATFGKVVERFFASGSTVGDPVTVSWKPEMEGAKDETDATDAMDATHLASYTAKDELKQTQETVDILRRVLNSPTGGAGADELRIHYRDFRTALKSGNEAMMQGNPFYELTQRVFNFNLMGINKMYCHLMGGLAASLPAPFDWWSDSASKEGEQAGRRESRARESRARESRARESRASESRASEGQGDQVKATWSQMLVASKGLLDLVLFLLSWMTTFLAMNVWLSGQAHAFLSSDGSQEDSSSLLIRYFLCGLIGFLLSLVILDFRARLLRGMAESGLFFQGIVDAFARNPRWMVLAAGLTMISFVTNYNTIVSLISIEADLTQHSKLLNDRVKEALGGWYQGEAVKHPNSLHDLHASLNSAIDTIQKQFVSLADDEIQVKPTGRGATPKKGPRYYAKRFILDGGYEPGVKDVVRVVKDNPFAQTMDAILRNSKMDLSLPLNARLNAIKGEYETHLAQTDRVVQTSLGLLTNMLHMNGGFLERLQHVLSMYGSDSSQINTMVREIVAALDLNVKKFQESAEKLHDLTNRYHALVGQLDNAVSSGSTTGAAQLIQPKPLVMPAIKALEELKKNQSVTFKRKDFTELKFFLLDRYGVSVGFVLLAGLLVMSVMVDMGPVFLYGSKTARRGAMVRRGFAKRMKQFKAWEEAFVNANVEFFARPDVRWVLGGLSMPDQTEIRNAVYRFCEKKNPDVKDIEDKLMVDKLDLWFRGVFTLPKNNDWAGYDSWVHVMGGVMSRLDEQFPKWIEFVFPGLHLQQGLGGMEFQEFFVEIRDDHHQIKEQFAEELKRMAAVVHGTGEQDSILDLGQSQPEDELFGLQKPLKKGLGGWLSKKWPRQSLPGKIFPGKIRHVGKNRVGISLGGFWMALARKRFLEPVPPFAHTRRNWLKELVLAGDQALLPSQVVQFQAVKQQDPAKESLSSMAGEDLQTEPSLSEVATPADSQSSLLVSEETQDVSTRRDVLQPSFGMTSSRTTPEVKVTPLRSTFDSNAIFQTSSGQELAVLVTDVDVDEASVLLEHLPLGLQVDVEGTLFLVTGHGGRYPFPCRVVGMGEGEMTVRLLTPDSLFATLYATLAPVVNERERKKTEEASFVQEKEALGEESNDPALAWSDSESQEPVTEVMVIDAASEAIQDTCRQIHALLWKIQVRGIELRKIRPSPQHLLRILGNNGILLEQTPRSVDALLERLQVAVNTDMSAPEEGRINYLTRLADESGELLHLLRTVADALEDPVARHQPDSAKMVQHKEDNRSAVGQMAKHPRQYRIAFQPAKGGFFAGVAGDITRNGLRMVADEPFDGVAPGLSGMIKLIARTDVEAFSVVVVRVAANEAILRVVDEQKRFAALAQSGGFGPLVCEQWDV
ncbi:MAG: hypothetical protein H7839_12270 [Magnetococcus sp. YQC-5]